MSAATELIAGGVAGGFGILATQPMDTIRIRLQSPTVNLGIARQYSGILDCARSAVNSEGVRGLYKGVGSPVLTVGFMNSLLFFSYEYASQLARRYSGLRPDAELSLQQVYCVGAMSGFASAFVTGPTELVKCIAQTNIKNQGYIREEWVILSELIAKRGMFSPHGPARGLAMTIIRDTPSFGFYFCIYEAGTRYVGKNDLSSFVFGGLSGISAWATVYPLDVLKTRWQIAEPGKYASVGHCIRAMHAEDGWRTFMRGFNATMVRAIPQNGVVFVIYEAIKRMIAS